MFSGLSIIDGMLSGLLLTILLKIPIAWLVTALTNYRMIEPRPEIRKLLLNSSIIALAGVFAFEIPFRLFGAGLIGCALGTVLFWVVVSMMLDHYFDIRYDQSYTNTGQIVIISLLSWLIVGIGLSWRP